MNQHIPSSLHLKIITPRRLLVEADVDEVSLPGLDGYLGIFPGHRPLFITLGKGSLTFRRLKKEEKYPVRGGYADILPDKVLVFTELSQDESEGTSPG